MTVNPRQTTVGLSVLTSTWSNVFSMLQDNGVPAAMEPRAHRQHLLPAKDAPGVR